MSCRKKVFDTSNGVYLFSSTPRISFNDNLAQLFKLVNMHNDIQNKLIELMAKQVLAKNLESIHSCKFFGIIADKYTDISNKELLSIYVFLIDQRFF